MHSAFRQNRLDARNGGFRHGESFGTPSDRQAVEQHTGLVDSDPRRRTRRARHDGYGVACEKHRPFVAVCELCAPQDHMDTYRWIGNGCPPSDRLALCKAYIAKAVWDFATTRDLIDAIRHRPALRRLCGWESLGEPIESSSAASRPNCSC